jgi:hypothetical protein
MKSSKANKSSKPGHRPQPPGPSPTKPLTLECAHTPQDPKYQQEVVYTILFTNPNNTGVTSVILEYDPSLGVFPSAVNFISATHGGKVSGGKIVWDSLGSLGPGESGIVSFTLLMDNGMDPSAMISSSAVVSIRSAQTTPATIEHLTVVIGWDELNWVVSCPKIVKRGQTFQYIIALFNNNTIQITALRGHLTFSPDVTFVELCSCAGTPVAEDILGGLMPGQSMTIIATVNVNSNAPIGTDVISMDCNFLCDESVGTGSGVNTSCQ